MSDIEYTPESHSDEDDGQGYWMGLAALNLVQELTMDEDPDVDRPDLWYASWEELQQPIEGYIDPSELSQRNTAIEQIRSLYMDGLEALYPQLAGIESMDELIMAMAAIPDAPPCDGSFSISYYTAENGNQRVLTYVESRIGEHTAMSIYVSDMDDDVLQSYNLSVNPNMDMHGSSVMALRDDERVDRELLEKVDPSQRNSLLRVMYGNLMPYEMELRLVEIHAGSADYAPEAVLDEVVAQARARYHQAVERKDQEVASGMIVMTMDDLERMLEIVNERIEQLG